MLLMDSIQKTKNFFHKTVENLKSFLFLGYRKLSKPPLPDPLSCTGCSRKKHPKDRSCTDFCNNWEVDLEEAKMRKNESLSLKDQMREEDDESSPVNGGKEYKKKARNSKLSKGEEQYYYKRNGGSYTLAQKMKELEMMDVGDMDHVLDVEEALHYYSRLRSPVYLSIVDKFFMDMYPEFTVPQASAASINNSSKRRFGSIRL